MAAVWQVNEKNAIVLDLSTDDIYGASGFRGLVGKEGSNEGPQSIDSNKWSEVVRPIEDNNCKADGDTLAGATKIKVKDTDDNNTVANFNKGDVFKVKDKDIYGYIEKVDTDNGYLYVRNPITGDIADGDEIDRVGNTGVYSCELTFNETGHYTVLVDNPSIDLQNEVLKIEVTDVNNKIDKILDAVNITKYPRARIYG